MYHLMIQFKMHTKAKESTFCLLSFFMARNVRIVMVIKQKHFQNKFYNYFEKIIKKANAM